MKAPTSYSNNYLPLFYFNVFFACVSFSIIMPSLAPYLERCGAGDPTFLAWVVCVYSLGEMVGSLMFGGMYNRAVVWDRVKGPRVVLCVVILSGIVGEQILRGMKRGCGGRRRHRRRRQLTDCNYLFKSRAGSVLYLLGDILSMPNLVFWGRALQGLWTGGQQSVEQAYLAFAALPGERTEVRRFFLPFVPRSFC